MAKFPAKRVSEFEAEYRILSSRAAMFSEELSNQLSQLLHREGVALAFPVQRRLKKWASIEDKFKRLELPIKRLEQLQDLVGLRIILLFRRDIETVCTAISRSLRVERVHDAGMHLKEDQFGYLGRHYIVGLPEEWTKVPTFAEVGDLVAEIQVRTLAQHMWAEASHLLQYKQEESVPNSIRRSLSRSSALLELLDLEFDRVLSERDDYRKDTERTNKAASINVDNLEQILDESLPIANKDDDESYSDLVAELSHFGVATVGDLRSLIDKRRVGALEQESKRLAEAYEELSEGRLFSSTEEERVSKGVFFSHVGLMRCMISDEFGREMLNNFWHSIDDTY